MAGRLGCLPRYDVHAAPHPLQGRRPWGAHEGQHGALEHPQLSQSPWVMETCRFQVHLSPL